MASISIPTTKQVQIEVCPFCTKDAGISVISEQTYFIKCMNCYAKGPTASEAELACNLWNGAVQSKTKAVQDAVKAGIDATLAGVAKL